MFSPLVEITTPPADWRGVVVAAAEPTGDRGGAAAGRERSRAAASASLAGTARSATVGATRPRPVSVTRLVGTAGLGGTAADSGAAEGLLMGAILLCAPRYPLNLLHPWVDTGNQLCG